VTGDGEAQSEIQSVVTRCWNGAASSSDGQAGHGLGSEAERDVRFPTRAQVEYNAAHRRRT
jgi:hypothetical protein